MLNAALEFERVISQCFVVKVKMNATKFLIAILFVSINSVLAGPGGYIVVTNRTPHVLVKYDFYQPS